MRKERRRVAIRRRTRGTDVEIELRLDGSGRAVIETPFPLLNELLDLMAVPSGIDLRMVQTLNKHADDPYAIDDLASGLAEAWRRVLGPRPRIRQFASAVLPVGDALVLAAVDLVSPPVFQFGATFRSRQLAGMDLALVERFLATFADRLGASIHIRVLSGAHDENRCRAVFVSLGRALAEASVEAEREGAREIAADVDYFEGIPRPPAGPAGLDEAVVEELGPVAAVEDFEEVGLHDDLDEGRERRPRRSGRLGRGDRGERPAGGERVERVGRGDRFERGEQIDRDERTERDRGERSERGERVERAERGERVERAERGERVERAERVDRVERGGRGERRDRRGRGGRDGGAEILPSRGDERPVPAEETEVPVLPDFDFEPAVSDEMGEIGPAGEVGEGTEEERRRRRRRGRRGGRGRRRGEERGGPLEAGEAAGAEEEDTAVAAPDDAPAPSRERADEPRERPGARPWIRGWEEEPAVPARERESYEAPDLEPGEPSAVRATGRPGEDLTPRFGRRSSRLPRPGEAPGSGAPPADDLAERPEPVAPEPPSRPAPLAAPGEDGVLDFISKQSEAKATGAQKIRRRRR